MCLREGYSRQRLLGSVVIAAGLMLLVLGYRPLLVAPDTIDQR